MGDGFMVGAGRWVQGRQSPIGLSFAVRLSFFWIPLLELRYNPTKAVSKV